MSAWAWVCMLPSPAWAICIVLPPALCSPHSFLRCSPPLFVEFDVDSLIYVKQPMAHIALALVMLMLALTALVALLSLLPYRR